MTHQAKRPHIHLGPILLLPKNLRWHKDGRANRLIIKLFLDRKAKIPDLVQNGVVGLSFEEDVVGFDVAVHHFVFGAELEATGELVDYLEGLGLGDAAAFGDYLLEVAVGA